MSEMGPRAAIPTGSMVGFVLIQDTRPSTALLAFDIGPSSRPRAANRSDQEAATVDHQSLAGHEGLSHEVEIARGNLLRVGDMPHR